MHLLAPWWWLLLIPLAGGLILLYVLKLKRRDYVVPSVFLWEQALQDFQANAPLQKLRKNLLLLLQLIAVLLLVAALSRPAMLWVRKGGQSVVLVIDASASMQSTDVSPSRFEAARRESHRLVDALGPRDRMMIVAIGGQTRALTSFQTDKRALHDALNRLAVTDAPADLYSAMTLASGLVRGKKTDEKPQVVIISDGALPEVNLPADFALPVHYQKIGKRAENVGIVMASVRQRLTRQAGYEGIIGIKNFSRSPRRFTLELSVDGRLLDAREMTLNAGAQRMEQLTSLPKQGSVLEAKLDIRDDLAVDNTAEVILPRANPVPVVLATTGSFFLETALSLDPTLEVTERATISPAMVRGTVLIADNITPPKLPPGVSVMLIGPQALRAKELVAGQVGKEVSAPRLVDWNHRHPALANVDLEGTHIGKAEVIAPSTRAESLIETSAGTVAIAAELPERRVITLGWDLHNSDFPLRAGFPIFMADCIGWLSGQRQRAQAANIRTGQAMQIPLPAEFEQVTLRTPDGRKKTVKPEGMTLALDQVTAAGLYQVSAKDFSTTFTANLFDAEESDLAPHDKLTMETPRGEVKAAPGTLHTEQEFWRALLLLAIVVLMAEWWIFHRRIG